MAEESPNDNDISSPKEKAEDAVRRDETYYYGGSYLVFQVEDRLFRLPSHPFENESDFFRDLFTLPQGNDSDSEGSSPTKPIFLPQNVRAEDFKNFIKALYPKPVPVHISLSHSEWISVLKLATEWNFLRLRKLAISQLELLQKLSPLENIVLGRKCGIPSWVIVGLEAIVNRDTTISEEEETDLDRDYVTTAYKLHRMREQRIRGMKKDAIGETFKDHLEDIRARQRGYSDN
ncbi:hypothetical protein CPB84DRAFT_1828287 [Gymnopilus junonius]|uniref:BTB domain-containing protein n=1 Tax=Gymnopilus junonius TaxID=109634 RepID=A0A9P5NFD9_GYMJU|nr:hypothetical protein CPB84DRAFT_1828287 [Gymnopilus junonius]